MANTIRGGNGDYLIMPGGSASTLLTALCLGGSGIAVTDRKRDFIILLAEHDHGVLGPDTVGFYIEDMPWNEDSFLPDKAFLLSTVDAAMSKSGFETLSYTPAERYLILHLTHFRILLESMTTDWIQETNIAGWYDCSEIYDIRESGYPHCNKHFILITRFGCIACSDDLAKQTL